VEDLSLPTTYGNIPISLSTEIGTIRKLPWEDINSISKLTIYMYSVPSEDSFELMQQERYDDERPNVVLLLFSVRDTKSFVRLKSRVRDQISFGSVLSHTFILKTGFARFEVQI